MIRKLFVFAATTGHSERSSTAENKVMDCLCCRTSNSKIQGFYEVYVWNILWICWNNSLYEHNLGILDFLLKCHICFDFQVDKNYVGALPETTIRFGCLNDNVNRQFLRELCSKFGKIEECKVYYDIKSKKHLGTGKITFSSSSSARQAVSQLDGSSVMEKIKRVYKNKKSM